MTAPARHPALRFSGVSEANTCPPNIIKTRLHIISTSGKMCVEISTRPSCKAFDQLPDRPDLVRIEADGWLVQDDQFRFMHQRVGQPDASCL